MQVAEMHGELMEFNEHLQRQLIQKEATVRRLTGELTELRGPVRGFTHFIILYYSVRFSFMMLVNVWYGWKLKHGLENEFEYNIMIYVVFY